MSLSLPRQAVPLLLAATIFGVVLAGRVAAAPAEAETAAAGVPAAEATSDTDAGRERAKTYRYDPMNGNLYPVTAREVIPGHVYGRYDAGLGRWTWSKADRQGNLRYAMGPGSTQPVRMFDLRGTDAERQRALERRAPELARLLTIQGARPMLRLDERGRWGLGPTPSVSSVFDEATGQRWEWHGDAPSGVVHSGGNRWRIENGWYAPGY